jgi:succinoglycan biosynthesis transport protein ExoP
MVLTRDSGAAAHSQYDELRYASARRRVFLLTFITAALAGIVYTLLQPSQYESSATVLMSAPTAIDQQMLDADVQGVAIQRRILTGGEITGKLSRALSENYGIGLDPVELRAYLQVEPVLETNLLELAAVGTEATLLPPLVETWIDVYSETRSADIESRKSRTLAEVEGELGELAVRLEQTRERLDAFRAENEIISMERQENEVLARLDGLNKALNNAIEQEVNSKAYLDTLRASLKEGGQVVPDSQRSDVSAMAERLAELRAQLAELRARYTDEYITKDARLREIPEQISELESTLSLAYEDGSRTELANAERAYRAARESVADLEARLSEHKQAVADFNTIYATHEALVADLARLEELNRETQARLVQIEVRQVEKYPQVSVVEWPQATAQRIGPPYLKLLGATAVFSLLLSIFAVWLYTYLHPKPEQPAVITLSGLHMYPQGEAQALEVAEKLQGIGSADDPRRLASRSDSDDGGIEDISNKPGDSGGPGGSQDDQDDGSRA